MPLPAVHQKVMIELDRSGAVEFYGPAREHGTPPADFRKLQ